MEAILTEPTNEASEGVWIDVCGGSPMTTKLAKVLRQYNFREDLSSFKRRQQDFCLELRARDESRGYVFVGVTVPVSRGFDAKMYELRSSYAISCKIKLPFTDFQNHIAGFSWEKSAGVN